jgi:hypothetical protein
LFVLWLALSHIQTHHFGAHREGFYKRLLLHQPSYQGIICRFATNTLYIRVFHFQLRPSVILNSSLRKSIRLLSLYRRPSIHVRLIVYAHPRRA